MDIKDAITIGTGVWGAILGTMASLLSIYNWWHARLQERRLLTVIIRAEARLRGTIFLPCIVVSTVNTGTRVSYISNLDLAFNNTLIKKLPAHINNIPSTALEAGASTEHIFDWESLANPIGINSYRLLENTGTMQAFVTFEHRRTFCVSDCQCSDEKHYKQCEHREYEVTRAI